MNCNVNCTKRSGPMAIRRRGGRIHARNARNAQGARAPCTHAGDVRCAALHHPASRRAVRERPCMNRPGWGRRAPREARLLHRYRAGTALRCALGHKCAC
jgi:hypothetical protein